MPANGRWDLTRRLSLILLTWRIWWAPNNASKWQMGFNLAFKGLKMNAATSPPLFRPFYHVLWQFLLLSNKTDTFSAFGVRVKAGSKCGKLHNSRQQPFFWVHTHTNLSNEFQNSGCLNAMCFFSLNFETYSHRRKRPKMTLRII